MNAKEYLFRLLGDALKSEVRQTPKAQLIRYIHELVNDSAELSSSQATGIEQIIQDMLEGDSMTVFSYTDAMKVATFINTCN